MSSTSPIKQNAILLKNLSRELTKLNTDIKFIRNELTTIRDILNMDKDNVNVEIITDGSEAPQREPTPMKVDRPTQTEIATEKGWFW